MAERTDDKRSRPLISWSIGNKLLAASILMITLVLLVGGLAIWEIHIVASNVNDAFAMEQQRAQSLELLAAGQELIASLHHVIITEDAPGASTAVPVSMGTFEFYMSALQTSDGVGDPLGELDVVYEDLRQAVGEVELLVRQERWDEAHTVLMQDVVPVNDRLGGVLRQLVSRNDRRVKAVIARTQRTMRQVRLLMLVGMVVTAAVALSWRQYVFRGMERSIAELRQGVARITGGDLERRLEIHTGDEIEELANEFNVMASRLADLIGSLEERVAERTRELEESLFELEGAAQVARQAASIRDVEQLLDETVHLISVLFGFYHTGIFMLDETKEYAVLQAASSEGGRRMLERGHRLKVGEKGIVGHVAGSGTPRIALDVGEDAVYFDNPDMPETRSEMAVPLEVRREIIGVLDVQSQEAKAFSDPDIAIIKSLADQIALAIENAHLLEESQQALQELEVLYGRRVREAWRSQPSRQRTAYRFTDAGVERARGVPSLEAQDEPLVSDLVIEEDEGDGRRLASPIRLRGQEIGSIILRQEPAEEPWSEEELALMEEVSAQIALALENARLLEETQRRAAREQLTREITDNIRSAVSVEDAIQRAIREVGRALEASEMIARIGPEPILRHEQGGDGHE